MTTSCIGVVLATALLLAVAAIVLVKSPVLWPVHRRSIQVVGSIESFRQQRGRLPQFLAELPLADLPDTLGVFYERSGDTSYEVWHGTWLGESLIYGSSTKSWHR